MIKIGTRDVKALYLGTTPVKAVYKGSELVWESGPSRPPYLTFHSSDGFALGVNYPGQYWDGTLECSTDGQTWATWDGQQTLEAANDGSAYKLMLRGIGNTTITDYLTTYARWVITGADVSCSGNIESILDYTTAAAGGHPTVGEGCFAGLFWGCSALVTPPALGFASFAAVCCESMFRDCVNLTALPRIFATNFEVTPCTSMFRGCSKIKLSEAQTGEYQTPYRLPHTGTGSGSSGTRWMFDGTGGAYTGAGTYKAVALNATYYTSNRLV